MTLLKPKEVEALRRAGAWTRQLPARIGAFFDDHGTGIGALGTFATALITLPLAIYAARQAGVMQDQLAETRAEQRPWVWLDVETTKPIVTDIAGNLGFTFSIALKNAGKLPATAVALTTRMLADEARSDEERQAEVHDVCHNQRQASASGMSLFPEQAVEKHAVLAVLPKSDLYNTSIDKTYSIRKSMILPYLLLCVVYNDPSGVTHHTPYVFAVGRWEQKMPGVHAIPSQPQDLNDNTDFGIWPWEWHLVNPD